MRTTQNYLKKLGNKTEPFHIKNYLENNKEMRILQYNQKKMLSVP